MDPTTITLLALTLQMIQASHQVGIFGHNDPSQSNEANQEINRLRNKTRETCQIFITEIDHLKHNLVKHGVDIERSSVEIQRDIRWWRMRQYRVIQDVDSNIAAIERRVKNITADLIAVVNCSGKQELMIAASERAEEFYKPLDGIDVRKEPLRKVLDKLRDTADTMQSLLPI
jgi:hypothetical protein